MENTAAVTATTEQANSIVSNDNVSYDLSDVDGYIYEVTPHEPTVR